MLGALAGWLFDPSGLTPHGFCLLWEPGLVWLHALSDVGIGLSYFTIPFVLFSIIRRRPDLSLPTSIRAFRRIHSILRDWALAGSVDPLGARLWRRGARQGDDRDHLGGNSNRCVEAYAGNPGVAISRPARQGRVGPIQCPTGRAACGSYRERYHCRTETIWPSSCRADEQQKNKHTRVRSDFACWLQTTNITEALRPNRP